MKLFVKNWAEFQHYKDRSPPWIKLHKGLLDNYEYQCLPLASRALAPMLWLIASESGDGSIEYNIKKISFRVRAVEQEVDDAIKALIDGGFLVLSDVACNPLADCKQVAMPEEEAETEAYKTETEGDKRVAASKPKKAIPFPDDFYPDQTGVDLAESLSVEIASELPKFSDYHKARGKPMKCWQAAWRTWTRNAAEFAKERRQSKQTSFKSVGQQRAETIAALTGRTPAYSESQTGGRVIDGEAHVA